MATVPVYIGGREYRLACDDGQEQQLVALAAEVDDRVRSLGQQLPHTSESMLLLLSSVMLADELADTRRIVRQLEAKLSHTGAAEAEQREGEEKLQALERDMAETLNDVAGRITGIAIRLESEYAP